MAVQGLALPAHQDGVRRGELGCDSDLEHGEG
jgi:hypothetical protein